MALGGRALRSFVASVAEAAVCTTSEPRGYLASSWGSALSSVPHRPFRRRQAPGHAQAAAAAAAAQEQERARPSLRAPEALAEAAWLGSATM